MNDDGCITPGMWGLSSESGQTQASHAFNFERKGEIIRAVSAPTNGRVFRRDVVGVAEVETRVAMRFASG